MINLSWPFSFFDVSNSIGLLRKRYSKKPPEQSQEQSRWEHWAGTRLYASFQFALKMTLFRHF